MAEASHHMSDAQVLAPAVTLLKLIERACHETLQQTEKARDCLPLGMDATPSTAGHRYGDLSARSKQADASLSKTPIVVDGSPEIKNTGIHTAYNPESPWGVLSLAYDPTSPQWTWKPMPTSPKPANGTAFEQTDSALTSESIPLVQRQNYPTTCSSGNSNVPKWGPGLTSFFGNNETSSAGRFVLANVHAPAARSSKGSRKAGHPVKKNRTLKNQQHPLSKTAHSGVPAATWQLPPRCCPVEVPSILHMILDRTGEKLDPRMVEQYSAHVGKLCPGHFRKYQQLKASMVQRPVDAGRNTAPELAMSDTPDQRPGHKSTLPVSSCTTPCPLPILVPGPPAQQAKHKRRRAPGDTHRGVRTPRAVDRSDIRPVANVIRDSWYRKQVLEELQDRFSRTNIDRTHGDVTNRIIYNLLSVAKQPNVSPDRGPLDARFLTGDEAKDLLDAGSPREPIVTEKEQMFRWHPRLRPIEELFRRMENLDRSVSVQVPSRNCMEDSFESRDLTQVRNRFLSNDGTDDPWNILDLRSPLPAAVLPRFLTCENCQLLPRLRDEVLNPSRAERDTATREQWNEWRDVLEWVLLSQGGHNTSPHTDSHGLGTWITVQEGLFGYGWMSHPTQEEHEQWMANPHGFTGGRWCYVILEPGQTVFFNSGTVHFVFRLRSEHTLALGGHILQWSGIERWLQIVEAQMNNPHITNEDMEWSAPKYVRVVARLVEARLRNGRVDEMGGTEAVQRLLRLLKEFDETYIKGRSQKGRSKKKRHR